MEVFIDKGESKTVKESGRYKGGDKRAAPLTTAFDRWQQPGQQVQQLLTLVAFTSIQRGKGAVHVFLGKPMSQLLEHQLGRIATRQETVRAFELVAADLVGRLLKVDN